MLHAGPMTLSPPKSAPSRQQDSSGALMWLGQSADKTTAACPDYARTKQELCGRQPLLCCLRLELCRLRRRLLHAAACGVGHSQLILSLCVALLGSLLTGDTPDSCVLDTPAGFTWGQALSIGYLVLAYVLMFNLLIAILSKVSSPPGRPRPPGTPIPCLKLELDRELCPLPPKAGATLALGTASSSLPPAPSRVVWVPGGVRADL